MPPVMVFTFVGADKPGLVEVLSKTVADHGGNWLESRMSELSGQFAGIVKVQIDLESERSLRDALKSLTSQDLSIVITSGNDDSKGSLGRGHLLTIIGNDRPGIVREVSSALASRGINVFEMNTNVSSAPMSGSALFKAEARIRVPAKLDLGELREEMNKLSNSLDVDIDIEESRS